MTTGSLFSKKIYFHGGKRGLRVGDYILPQSETGVVGMSHPLHRKDRVYVTPSIVDAQFYASGTFDPIVYEVRAEGGLELDPDAPDRLGLSYSFKRAKIIAVRKIQGKVIKRHRKAMFRKAHELERARRNP